MARARWLGLALPTITAGACIGLWLSLPTPDLARLIAEHGPVEHLTERLFVLAALLAAVLAGWGLSRGHRNRGGIQLALSVLLLACALREMDLHRLFADSSMLKLSFYLGDMPASVKVIALTVVSLIAAAVIYLGARVGRALWARRRPPDAASTSLLIFIAVLVVTKLIDRLPAILAENGFPLSAPTSSLLQVFEELSELSLPLIAMLGLYQCRLFLTMLRSASRRPSSGASFQYS
jgi:hypothetical protein